jgi:hypothetical protein
MQKMKNTEQDRIEKDAPSSEGVDGMNQDSPMEGECSQELIDLLGKDRIRRMRNPPRIQYPRQLPIVEYAGKKWFLDVRLRQIRNVIDTYDYIDLDEDEVLAFGAAAIMQSLPDKSQQRKDL